MAEIDKAQWSRLSPLFDAVLDADEAGRAELLARVRRDDGQLADDLAALLARHVALMRAPFLDGAAVESGGAETLAGQVVGNYTIERALGHGGMGSVWLARRSDGRYQGLVAIKFMDLALLSRGGLERFEREGSLLAKLTHPNIVRMLDAGVTTAGQPYLALEYVEGQRIDEYCSERSLDMAARIRLFLDIVSAVAHAHSQLVVHRDLKPSNVLVTAQGQVKLLDFGIAKLIDSEPGGGDDTLTRQSELALTPEYAAPEQLRDGESTTATDIYQLGMLLYVLLVGKHPWHGVLKSRAERFERALEGRVGRASEAAVGPDRRQLQGDLDAIMAMALRETPADRYVTAAALRDDLHHFLEGEPVGARRGARAYRVQKFVGRHRVAVGASVIAVGALVAALSYALVQAQVARAEARRAADINTFILSLFESASLSGGGGSELRAVDLLQQSLPRIDRELAGQPERQIEIYLSVGRALDELNAYKESLQALARVEEVSSRHGLADAATTVRARIETASALVSVGDLAKASSVLDAVDQSLSTAEPGLLHARALAIRSYLQLNQQRPPEAVRSGVAAVALFERHAGRAHPETLSALLSLVRARYHADECAAGLPEIDDALTRVPAGVDDAIHPLTWILRGVRARCLADVNRTDESAAEFERNDAYIRTTFGAESRDYATELIEHARVEHDRGNFDAGLALLDRADAIYTVRGPFDRNQYSVSLRRVQILVDARRVREAHAEAERLRQMVTTKLQDSPVRVTAGRFFAALTQGLRGGLGAVADAASLAGSSAPSPTLPLRFRMLSGWLQVLVGDPGAALRHLESAMPEMLQRGSLGARTLTAARLYAGHASLDLGNVDRAREYLEQALAAHPTLYSAVTPERADLWVGWARLHLQNGDAAAARKFAEEADTFWSQRDARNPWAGEAAYWLGRTLEAAGDRAMGREAFRRASTALRTSSLPVHLALAADASTRAGPTGR